MTRVIHLIVNNKGLGRTWGKLNFSSLPAKKTKIRNRNRKRKLLVQLRRVAFVGV